MFCNELIGPRELSVKTHKALKVLCPNNSGVPELPLGAVMAHVMIAPVYTSSVPFGVALMAWGRFESKEIIVNMAQKLGSLESVPGYEVKGEFASWDLHLSGVFALFGNGFCVSEGDEAYSDYDAISPFLNHKRSLAIVEQFSQFIKSSAEVDPWAAYLVVGATSKSLAEEKFREAKLLLLDSPPRRSRGLLGRWGLGPR